jgi:hypothetical protein
MIHPHDRERILAKRHVLGIGQAGNHAVVLVDRKVPLTELEEEDVIDPYIEDTNTVAEQDTDVIEVGHVKALSCLWRKKARPEDIRRMPKLYPGASIGHESVGAGTLGAIVKDRRGTLYALTNNHVAAASNQARLLDPVYSPARKDQPDGLPMVEAGDLECYVPIRFDEPNYMDAALVRINYPERAATRTFFTYLNVAERHLNERIHKRGRTSNESTGRITAVQASIKVDFGHGFARFDDQVFTTPMLEPGDSGSVGYSKSDSNKMARLLGFAGSNKVSIWTPIRPVLDRFGVKLA